MIVSNPLIRNETVKFWFYGIRRGGKNDLGDRQVGYSNVKPGFHIVVSDRDTSKSVDR